MTIPKRTSVELDMIDELAGSPNGFRLLPELLKWPRAAPLARSEGPLPAGTARQVLARAESELGPAAFPELGCGVEMAMEQVSRVMAQHGLDLTHPRAAAHLQPPVLTVAVAADALASMSNASVDTFDSGPGPIAIERWVVQVLAGLVGFGPAADGVMTPGGSMSNLLALMLARDAAARRRGIDARNAGISALSRPVVLCSSVAHFSVHRACAALGLGERAAVSVEVDEHRRMKPEALIRTLEELPDDACPVAIVATAGTTDFGSVDPLPELVQIAQREGIWLHVDAAYGFGALLSSRLSHLMKGVSGADSVTLDLHKLGWQPAAASVLLVDDGGRFSTLSRNVPYLNPSDDAEAGYTGLLGNSLQTTRRADAVKVAATFLAYGRRKLGQLVDRCHDLAVHAHRRLGSRREVQLVAPVVLTTVVFRLQTDAGVAYDDELNARVRRLLLEEGSTLIGRTTVPVDGSPPRVCLKLTFLNPYISLDDVDDLVDTVLDAGVRCLGERRLSDAC